MVLQERIGLAEMAASEEPAAGGVRAGMGRFQDQMLWVRKMNNIRNVAEEIVLKEVVYG